MTDPTAGIVIFNGGMVDAVMETGLTKDQAERALVGLYDAGWRVVPRQARWGWGVWYRRTDGVEHDKEGWSDEGEKGVPDRYGTWEEAAEAAEVLRASNQSYTFDPRPLPPEESR